MKTLLLSALALFAGVSSYAQTTDKKEIISVWSGGHRIAILLTSSLKNRVFYKRLNDNIL